MAIEFTERVRRIPSYPVASGYDLGANMAMLASNESPWRPPEGVLEAAGAALRGVHRYPDPSYSPLRRALSDRYGVPPGRIALGNGSCDILLTLGAALLEPGAEVLFAWPSFSVYQQIAASSGASAVAVALDEEDRHDLTAIAAGVTVATRLVLVCNPNNPTSTALPLHSVQELLDRVPSHVCVVLDEAYCEFSLQIGDPYASVELLERHSNLVLLRTFSKVYGLAGLRAGYALCGSEDVRAALDGLRQPFHLSAPAQAAATAALARQDIVEDRVARTVAGRLALRDGLRALGLWVAESDANFIWTRLPPPESSDTRDDKEAVASAESQVVRGLSEAGVLVRAGVSLGRPGALRVTVGTDAENERFLEALSGLLVH